MGRAGSVVLLFVQFRDGGRAVGYTLDKFTVKNFYRGCSSKGFWGWWEAGMDRGRRGGSAVLLSNRIGGADFGGGGGRSERAGGDPSMWWKGVFRGKHAEVGICRSATVVHDPL